LRRRRSQGNHFPLRRMWPLTSRPGSRPPAICHPYPSPGACASPPEVGAGCGNAARPDLWRGWSADDHLYSRTFKFNLKRKVCREPETSLKAQLTKVRQLHRKWLPALFRNRLPASSVANLYYTQAFWPGLVQRSVGPCLKQNAGLLTTLPLNWLRRGPFKRVVPLAGSHRKPAACTVGLVALEACCLLLISNRRSTDAVSGTLGSSSE